MQYPWFATDLISVDERDRIFETSFTVCGALADQLRRGLARRPLSIELLQELIHAVLICPGFGEGQRARLLDRTMDLVHPSVWVTPFAAIWPFQVLRRNSESSEHLVEVRLILQTCLSK